MTNVEYKCEGHGFAMNLLMAMHIKGISLLWVSWVSWERGETPLTRKGPETDRLRWARGRELKRFRISSLVGASGWSSSRKDRISMGRRSRFGLKS